MRLTVATSPPYARSSSPAPTSTHAQVTGPRALLWAAHNSNDEIARALIAAKAAVDVPNDFGVTPLLEASRNGDAAMVDLLLRAGADPKRSHPEGETPLLGAARAGSVPAVRLLLARGVDVNAAETFQQTTALMWAAAEGHTRRRRSAARGWRGSEPSGRTSPR